MARPRKLKEPVRLNLLIDLEVREKAGELARQRGISVSRLFTELLKDHSTDGNGREGSNGNT